MLDVSPDTLVRGSMTLASEGVGSDSVIRACARLRG